MDSPNTSQKPMSNDSSKSKRRHDTVDSVTPPTKRAKRKVVHNNNNNSNKSPPPVRPLSAYNFFFQDERRRWLAEVRGQSERPSNVFANMGKEMGRRWKALSPERLAVYQNMARADAARFAREKKEYVRRETQQAWNDFELSLSKEKSNPTPSFLDQPQTDLSTNEESKAPLSFPPSTAYAVPTQLPKLRVISDGVSFYALPPFAAATHQTPVPHHNSGLDPTVLYNPTPFSFGTSPVYEPLVLSHPFWPAAVAPGHPAWHPLATLPFASLSTSRSLPPLSYVQPVDPKPHAAARPCPPPLYTFHTAQ